MIYDAIVIGAGTMGSAACACLASKGVNVLGLEQFTIPHDLGSHSGYTRIIRQAYYEHPGYVPLLQRSYQLWNQLESDHKQKIYHETGILYMGQSDSSVLTGTLKASQLYNIPLTRLPIQQMSSDHPQFQIPSDWGLLWEPNSGYLDVNRAITGFHRQAIFAGATIQSGEKVVSWIIENGHVEVKTSRNTYQAKKLILTAGPWTQKVLTDAGLPLKVTRQVLAWIEVPETHLYSQPLFPCWFLHDPELGMFYGFPVSMTGNPDEPKGIKLGLHMPGTPADPDQMDREINDSDKAMVIEFIKKYMPDLENQSITYKTCMYTYTPDEHFILDYLPDTGKKVILAAGFSGHGFKFAPVIGEILTDFYREKPSGFDLGFLSLRRFQTK